MFEWIAYFYLETSNFKLAQKCSFHVLKVLPVARNAKFQPMCPLPEGVRARWFGHWWKADPSASQHWYFCPAIVDFNFESKKKSHGALSGEYGGVGGWSKTVTFSFFKNAVIIAVVGADAVSCRRRICLNHWQGVVSDNAFSVSSVLRLCSIFRWCLCPFSPAL